METPNLDFMLSEKQTFIVFESLVVLGLFVTVTGIILATTSRREAK